MEESEQPRNGSHITTTVTLIFKLVNINKMATAKTPSQHRSRDLVRSVLEGAYRAVRKFGPQKATIDRISKEAGVSPGSIYQYFENKDSLLSSVAGTQIREQHDLFLQTLKSWQDLPIPELNRRFTKFVCAYLAQRADFLRYLYSQSSDFDQLQAVLAMRRETAEALAEIFERRNDLQLADSNLTATVLVQAVMGVVTSAVIDPHSSYSVEQLCEELVLLIDRYLLNGVPAGLGSSLDSPEVPAT